MKEVQWIQGNMLVRSYKKLWFNIILYKDTLTIQGYSKSFYSVGYKKITFL